MNLRPDPYLSVVPTRSEHGWVGWVPGHRVDTTMSVAFECFDESAVLLVPYVYLGIYSFVSILTMCICIL